uniref:Uncharacterized protein n=1 Tax=Anguilla anguilla TaxID=7936 RepID=A0A0E9R127_ANGAN
MFECREKQEEYFEFRYGYLL